MRPSHVTWCAPLALLAAVSGGCNGSETSAASDAGPTDATNLDVTSSADTATPDAAPSPDAQPDAAPDAAIDQGAPDAPPDAPAPPTTLDLHQVTLFDNPSNLADWPVTTQITDVEFQYMGADGVHVEFTKKDGAGSWPDVTPPGWMGPLEYTLGMVELINGKWYGSAAIQYWRGLAQMGGNVAADTVTMGQCMAFGAASTCQVAKNWYYDGRWGNLAGYQPATGEIIGIFVAAGNTRGVPTADPAQSPVQERSNVVLMPMPPFAGAKYTF